MNPNDPILVTAISAGVLGGFGHCTGMCGPIAAGMALATSPSGRKIGFASIAFYNLGRITTYTILGGFMGLVGSFLNVVGHLADVQNAALILAAVLMVLMGLDILGLPSIIPGLERSGQWVIRRAARRGKARNPLAFFPVGLLLGLLPCGLSYTILMAAAGTADPVQGGMALLVFGIGTLPAMVSVGTAAVLFGGRLRGWLYRAGGLLVVLSGLYLLYLGLKPYADL